LTIPQAELSFPQGKSTIPQTKLSFPQGMLTIPQTELSFPRGKSTIPRAELGFPQGKSTIPQAMLSSPQARTELNQARGGTVPGHQARTGPDGPITCLVALNPAREARDSDEVISWQTLRAREQEAHKAAGGAPLAARNLTKPSGELRPAHRSLRRRSTSFRPAAEAYGGGPQAYGWRQKLAAAVHKLPAGGRSLRRRSASFRPATEACGGGPQASGWRLKRCCTLSQPAVPRGGFLWTAPSLRPDPSDSQGSSSG